MFRISRLVERNARYAAEYHDPEVPLRPSLQVAVVACMDARLDIHSLLGLELGDVHVIRNAGGAVTDDVVRSLAVSQRKLGTRHVVLIHHTNCGMQTFTDDEFRDEVLADTGMRPTWAVEAFHDLDDEVRQSIQRVRRSPFLGLTEQVHGYVYDVHTGLLREIDAPADAQD